MRRIGVAASAAVAAVVLAAGALANGGGSIAAAPTIAIDQQQFGNTTDGCYQNCYSADYWKVPLIAADKVTIDWESNQATECNDTARSLYVWPIGTTDFSINNTGTIQNFSIGSNHKQEATFTANATGLFPIAFIGCYGQKEYGGAYDFTVHLSHKLVTHVTPATAALLARGRSATLPRRGTFSVQAFTADGKPVANVAVGGTLTGHWASAWHPLGKAVARSGVVSVHYRLPASASGPLRLQLNLGGGSYQGVKLSFRGLKA